MKGDFFAIRVLPIFVTVILFILSLASHPELLDNIKKMDSNVVMLWMFFFSLLAYYTISKLYSENNVKEAYKGLLGIFLLGITIFYLTSWANLGELLEKTKTNPTLGLIWWSLFAIIPLFIFYNMKRESKFSYGGAFTFAVSLLGIILMGLNSHDFVEHPTKDKISKTYRILAGVIPAAILLLIYMDTYYVHTKRYDKRALVWWFLTSVLTIAIKENNALKDEDIPEWVWFGIISVVSIFATVMIYRYPSKGDFKEYSSTIAYLSLLSVLPVLFLINSDEEKYQQYGKIWWSWLLSFMNITFIDGYVKFITTSKKASVTFDYIPLAFMTLPVIVNLFLAIYITYNAYLITIGYITETKVYEEQTVDVEDPGDPTATIPQTITVEKTVYLPHDLTKTQLSFLTAGTYLSGILSFTLNTANLEETILAGFLDLTSGI